MTEFLKPTSPKWIIIDCSGVILGRLAAFIAYRLRGKHNERFSPHVDCGDHIIAINSDKIISYNKKTLYRHTGYPGGIKSISLQESLAKNSDYTLRLAVKRMLPRDRLLKNLRIYKGAEHEHHAQNPQEVNFALMNKKNIAR